MVLLLYMLCQAYQTAYIHIDITITMKIRIFNNLTEQHEGAPAPAIRINSMVIPNSTSGSRLQLVENPRFELSLIALENLLVNVITPPSPSVSYVSSAASALMLTH